MERNCSHPAAASSTMELNSMLPLPLDRPPAGRCFTSRTMGHDLGVARSYPISVGRSMPHRPPAEIFLLFAGKTRTRRMWMCVHVGEGACKRDSSTCSRSRSNDRDDGGTLDAL